MVEVGFNAKTLVAIFQNHYFANWVSWHLQKKEILHLLSSSIENNKGSNHVYYEIQNRRNGKFHKDSVKD